MASFCVYESITVRNTTVDVRRHWTTGHQGEKPAVGMQTLLAFCSSHFTEGGNKWACLHSFLLTAGRAQLPVSPAGDNDPVGYSVAGPSTM